MGVLKGGIPAFGWIMITDVESSGSGSVGDKVYQTATPVVLLSAAGDATGLNITVESAGPKIKVNGTIFELNRLPNDSHFGGTVPITLSNSGTIRATLVTPNNTDGAFHFVSYVLQVGPEILTVDFTGGYPGSQTELKVGDTFQITGTLDNTANLIEVEDFGACSFQQFAITPGTAFTVTATIANRGTTTQALRARVRARNTAGSFGNTRDTASTVLLNNQYPTFVDNGTTYPIGQLAFKNTEAGFQNTAVAYFTTLLYNSPTGDFAIGSPTVYVQNKSISLVNPGTYNDSVINFRIVAVRSENNAIATFTKVIEVADIAPTITVTQPQTRLRSGGNSGTSAQNYTITATSNQNLAATPLITIPVGGTWQGVQFVGGLKIYTRVIQIHDNNAKGSGAWVLTAPVTNRAGLAASITGNQVNGGFVSRDIYFTAFASESLLNVPVANTAKLYVRDIATNLMTFYPNLLDHSFGYSITQPSLIYNSTGNILFWCDVTQRNANASGTAYLRIEELI
jgi:hypothetical protein